MNYGLYLSASGVLTNAYRQDVYANNLANVETVAFKRDIPIIRQRDPATVENPALAGEFSQRLLEKLGGGALAAPQKTSFASGPQKVGGPMDAALEGNETFFAVSTTDPATGKQAIRLTRDGRFSRDGQGYLISAAGDRVLDTNNQPIQIPNGGPVSLDTTGHVIQNGESVGQIQVTGVSSTDLLHKEGQNLFSWDGKNDVRRAATDASIRPGYVEGSGVDPVHAILDMIDATKEVSNNGNLIHYHDLMMNQAINTFGRVA